MSSQGALYPAAAISDGSVNGSSVDWGNPLNVGAQDSSVALAASLGSGDSEYLVATNFGFSIPVGAIIDGVMIRVSRTNKTGACRDSSALLVVGGAYWDSGGGVPLGDEKAQATTWPSSETTTDYGSSSDLWNLTLTRAIVNASDFGFAIAAHRNSGTANPAINSITATVTYTAAPVGGSTRRRMLMGVGS